MSLPKTILSRGMLEVISPRRVAPPEMAVVRPRWHAQPSMPSRIAVIGNYLPRHCGIATFTTDLCEAISAEYGTARLLALPVNDTEQGYDYPARVRWSLAQDDVASYQEAAEFLNFHNIDMVCLQHEYGIFGGPAGSHILDLLRGLKMPVVTTLHTVLREPNPDQLSVMKEIAELSDRLIVMSQLSSQFLQEIFKVPGSKIDLVPHGVPDLPFLDPNFYKDRFGVEGKAVLLTFGLLSPNKGIENVIQAMPQILAKHENVVYLVAGATHPHILRREGDKYRAGLQALAKEMGVESQVIFHDRFVSPEEMAEFIGAADIYITPYRHEAQVVSGTLAYALGAGKAIISTPYWHAIELLDEGRGALVPFQDPDAIAQKTIELLTTPALRHAMRKRAYLFGRDMVWKKTAQGYMGSFARVRSDRMENPRVQFSARATEKSLNLLPSLKLDHVNALTDDTGMLQHAIFTIPNRAEGYTTDDNARALIFTVLMNQLAGEETAMSEPPKPPIPIGHSATWHFSSTLSMPRTKGSETSSATTIAGWKSRDRKILTAAPCGLWEPSSAGRRIQDCGALPGVCSSTRCPPWSSSTARGPAPTPCSEFRNTSIRTLETATPSAYDSLWLKGCSLCMSRSTVRTGSGLKMWWRTGTPGCPRPCCWWDRLAAASPCFPPASIPWNG